MGWDIVTIGTNHNLPVGDPIQTPEDLSKGESTQESIHEQGRSIRESIRENPTSLKSI